MQDIREINNLIKEKIKTPELSDIYAAIAHNTHLDFATAVKLGGAFGAVAECDTYDGWNSRGIRVRKGQHALYEIPERSAVGIVSKIYFSEQQTTSANRNKRTLQSLFKHLNDYSFMKVNAAKVDFAALCAAVRNYANDNGVFFDADFEPVIVTGIASILAHTCKDSSSIEIAPQPFPDRDYLENANLLKEVGAYALNLLELIEIAESKAEDQRSVKSNVSAPASTTQSESGQQINLFDNKPDTAKQQTPQPEPVADSPAVQLLPMYQSYLAKKAAYPGALIFQRVGDFYEVLGGEDTKKLSEILDLTITGRMVGLPERMPMVGIPYHAIDNYISRLLEDGTYQKIVVADDMPEVPDRVAERTPELSVIIEEAKAKAAARQVTFEEGCEKARAEAERTGEPYVTIEWSENPAFNTGDVFSFYQADNLFTKLDKEYSDIGYDKVKFHIDFTYKGQIEDYDGRYDIGDKDNGLINHIDSFGRYSKTEEARRDFAELCQYLRLHKNLSDIFETFEGSSQEIRAVFDYIKTTRATLNSTEHVADFVLPEPPEVLRSNKKFNEIMYGAAEEAAPVQEEQPNTVVAAPMAQEPPAEELDDIAAEEERLTFGGAKTRFKDNIEALKVYRRLSDTGAAATPAEKAILKKYIGWGGLSEVFDVKNAAWAEERRELTKYLSPYEYDAAQSTVTDAFYTPFTVVKGIYAALERFGVKGNNRILEPSMGVGNFFRVMPDKIKEGSELTGVEIDHVSGEIAKLIYPEANITVKGFEKTLLPAAHFDIVVGNVPFGNSKPVDIEKDYNYDLHNFVIAKSVDKTRAGGVIALITTSSTMNDYNSDVRQYIADRAKFLGAIRLPYDTFKANANTSVTTDIIFLQKREEIINSNDSWINSNWRSVNDNLDKDFLNDYFAEHPEMILGEYKKISGRFGYHTVPLLNEGETLQGKLAEAIAHLPANIFTPIERNVDEPTIDQLPADESVRNFCFTIVNGKLYQRQGDILVGMPIKTSPKNAFDRISSMIELRKEVRNILKIQLDNCSDEELKATQGVLNTHYDEFVKKYGYLHSAANKGLFQNDADCQLLLSLEIENSETKEISKADIFTKRSISPATKPQHTDSAVDALQICKSERGRVDIKFIEELTGKDFETVVNELKGFIFKNPKLASDYDRYRGYEAAEKYLSGDVKTKLQEAEFAAGANEDYIDNIRALKDVQPAAIPAEDIIVSLGATWIDTDIYEQFFCEDILKIPYLKSTHAETVNVSYNDLINGYIVDADLYGALNSEANTNTYGTSYISAVELFEQALNLKSPNIYDADRDADGNPIRVFNPKKTALAREKQTKLKTEFAQWIFSDEKRREYLTQKYNDLFNRNRVAEYDGSSLTFPEMSPLIELEPHQMNAVYRGMADGTALFHHCVGAGKTFEMDALIMKLRQSGLAHKPLQVVPKATLEQAEIEFRKLYPNANLLVASNEDFKKDRLKAFTAKIALGDWDCIIMSSSQFDRINVSPERRAKKLSEEIEKITTTISRAQRARGRKDDGLSVKQLQRILKTKRAELERLMTSANADDSMRFEDLGIDYLFVDEAHFYKNKYFFTKMSNVAGINSASSKRASALDLKIDYINELHGGDKGVIFATGTPISNSMSEMYTMQSYLQKEQLRKLGLDTFDAWASTFGEIVKSYELKPSGNGYRTRERFASFVNVPELMTMYGMFADVKMLDELKLPVPHVKYEKVIAPKTAQVAELMLGIAARAESINRGGVDPTVDNMLKITTDGKKIALDPRLFDATLGEPEGGKLQLCAEKVAEIYHATSENKSTQMIFCDSSTPKSGMSFKKYNSEENFNVYFEMKKKLIQLGVAEDEIAFIHDYEEDAKIKLKEAMTTGKIRVLIGSTSKCGTGLNVQKKLIAGHHLDIPYRPSDMEQREGRIIRQGNENNDVTIYTYAQEGTFDVYLFQILETKQKFIKQLLDFKIGSRKIEDIADNSVLSYGEMKAAISGNPAIIELEQLKQKIDNLNLLHAEYQRNLFRLQAKINTEYPREIERATRNIANLERDCEMIAENKTEEFEITINDRRFEGRTEEAGEAFMAAYNEAAEGGAPFAQYCGFAISKDTRVSLAEAPKLILKGSGKYTLSIGDSGVGGLIRLTNLINDFSNKLYREKMGLEQAEKDLEEAKKEATQPFTRADELAATVARIEELRTTLEISDVATDDVVIDSSEKPGEDESVATDENNYRRLPLEYLEKDELYSEIAQRFSADEIDGALRKRTRDPKLFSIKTSGIDYSNIGSYSYEDLKAAREKLHSYVTKRGFVIEDLIQARDGITNAIVHRVMKDAAGNTTLDDYLIALNYNVNTGEWAQGKYDFNSLKSATDFYNREYAADNVKELSSDINPNDVVKVEAIEHWVLTGSETFRNVNSGFAILHNEKSDEWYLFKDGLEIVKSDGPDSTQIYVGAEISFSDIFNHYDIEHQNDFIVKFSDKDEALNYKLMESAAFRQLRQDYAKLNTQSSILQDLFDGQARIASSLSDTLQDPDYRKEVEQIIDLEYSYLKSIAFDGGAKYDALYSYFKAQQADNLEYLDDKQYEALFRHIQSGGGVLTSLYEEYKNHFSAPLVGVENITDLIEQFNQTYYQDVLIKRNEVRTQPKDIKTTVQERVSNEFEAYKKALVRKGPEEVFFNSFETYVKTELRDTINSEVSPMSDEVWRALNAEGEGILNSLYLDFIGTEYASVNTYDDTAAFIQEYCEQYQSAIMNGEAPADVPEELDTPEKRKIKDIVERIVREGTENTSEGNWVVYFDEFKDDEQFVREHKEEIAEALSKREEVSEIAIEGESFDTTYYLDFCLSHADSRLAEDPASKMEETIYYGKNNDDTAFYYLPEKLSFDTLPEIKAEAFQYVIAAPVCYIAKERLDELGIQFLKIGRDIAKEDLVDYVNYMATIKKMEDAVSKVLDDENARLFAEAEARAAGIDPEANPEPQFLRFTKYGSPINAILKRNEGEYAAGKYVVAVINNYAQGEQAEFYEGYPAGYIIAHDYNAETGEFVEAAYGFETYEEARKYYKDNYDVDLGESLLPELSEEYRRKATAEALLRKQLYGVVYNWKGLKEENSVYTAEQLQAVDEDFKPELDRQDGAFAANKTYIVYKLNGATVEETAANVKDFMTGGKNDDFDGSEMPEGWYWETTTDHLFTGGKNATVETLIKHLNLSEKDLIMPEVVEEREAEERSKQIEREQAIAREDFPRDFEDELTETLLDDIEERRGTLNNPSTEKTRDIVDVRGASRTFYKGYVALMHPLNKNVPDSPVEVYLGKKENYDEKGHYDNSDNSLIFVSTNPKMFSFIRDSLWVYSQQQFIEEGIFTEQDYKEFFNLKNGLLKNLETTGEILFSVDPEKPGSGEPFKFPEWKEISTPKDVHAKAAPKSTTLGEDLANAPSWNKVILPTSAIAIKGDKNVKIVMPEGSEHSGAEFWVSKKFIKNATEKNFKLILPEKYTVQLKTPQGGALSLPARQVVDELAQHVVGYEKEPLAESPEDNIIDLDAEKKSKEVEINPASISELNLSALRQDLVKNLVAAMGSGNVEWIRSWATSLPKNGSTGREYAGINNLLLSLEKHRRGYSDSRWCTFNQIQDHKWKLKKGSKAAQIEVVKFIDRTTKKEFNEQSVDGMTEEERKEYWAKNVYPIMRSYSVFNADCIEGIPPEKLDVLNETERNERCEKILANSPAKIFYDGGNDAYYSLSTDTIHLPKRERFYSMDDFYYTALHEEGHSTGHPTRLNRNMSGMAGSENYAREELCAEIGSLFIGQSLGLKVSDAQLKSSAAYLKGWATKIKNDPKYLFTAITEANKISKFVLSLQAGASAANNFAAQETRLETMQRNGAEKQTGSAFAGKAMGKPDTAKSKNSQTTNIME